MQSCNIINYAELGRHLSRKIQDIHWKISTDSAKIFQMSIKVDITFLFQINDLLKLTLRLIFAVWLFLCGAPDWRYRGLF